VAYDAAQGYLLVTNSGSNNVSVISDTTNEVVSNFPVGKGPYGIGFDIGKGEAFVPNFNSANVTVVVPGSGGGAPPHYTVTCTETGLPAGTNWSVTLNGTPMSSTSTTILFSEPSGTYGYTVGAVAGYTPNPSSGSVPVSGAAASLPITFTANSSGGYAVTFTETGLATGTNWTVTLNSVPKSSTTTTVVFTEPDGTYPYTVTSMSADTPTPSSGSVPVSGAPVGLTITFTAPGAQTYAVTFTETGLPAGSSWQVTLNGQTQTSTTTGTTFTRADGTYAYSTLSPESYAPVPASGNVTVSGQAVTTPIVYYEVFPLSLSETGLPAGANWSATLTKTGTGVVQAVGSGDPSLTRWSDGASTVQFSVSNGTWGYSTSASGYAAPSGTVTVNGASPPTTTLAFAASSSPSSSSGFPTLEVAAIAIVAIVVVALVALAALRRRGRSPPPQPPAP
jgi:YVTN family beta-propeller protein